MTETQLADRPTTIVNPPAISLSSQQGGHLFDPSRLDEKRALRAREIAESRNHSGSRTTRRSRRPPE